MAMWDTDLEVLTALRAAQREHPDLAALLSFYADLYELQYRAKPNLPEPRAWEPAARRQRLGAGLPQLTFDQLGLEESSFRPLVGEVAELLRQHNSAREVEASNWAPDGLIEQARQVFETWDTLTRVRTAALGSDTLAPGAAGRRSLAVAFALAPYLQRAAAAILPGLDLAAWVWARCPVCGGEPNLALLDQERGGRRLVCSRCDSTWTYVRVGCPFCRSKDAQNYYPSHDGLYRLYVCPSCKRYFKTVDLRAARRPIYPVVERLLMVGMDLAARQAGYGSQSD